MTTVIARGLGRLPLEIYKIHLAVAGYDERLYVKRNEDTGQWGVYIKTPHTEPDVCIFGWNPDEFMSEDKILRRLYQADAVRHGEQILDKMDRYEAERQKQLEYAASEGTGQAAEAMEWAMRVRGHHPVPRIFVPRGFARE